MFVNHKNTTGNREEFKKLSLNGESLNITESAHTDNYIR